MKRAKTNLYSRLWYVRRNRKKLYVYIFPLTMLIVLIMLFLYFENVIKPSFLEFSDYKIKAIINNSVAKAVNDNFPEEINY
ncbi:MAG TPA: sporulation protein YunB, partial [Acetivibrio saccincola]|nr:sporulation protein YunB [Acetivibrio saccincola]